MKKTAELKWNKFINEDIKRQRNECKVGDYGQVKTQLEVTCLFCGNDCGLHKK